MKKFFLGLIAFGLSIISFGYCSDAFESQYNYFDVSAGTQHSTTANHCYRFGNLSAIGKTKFYDLSGNLIFGGAWNSQYNMVCVKVDGYFVNEDSINTSCFEYDLSPFVSTGSCDCPTCPTCSNYKIYFNSRECDDGDCYYGFSSSENITQNIWLNMGSGIYLSGSHVGNGTTNYYLGSNEVSCPVYTGNENLSGENWSALFINGIQHASSPLINISIADWVVWDYSNNESGFDLWVGSGYDQDYIDGVIDVQSYRPTSEDFTQTFVGGLILFTPYVIILLFVILVWKLIKGIFKTK